MSSLVIRDSSRATASTDSRHFADNAVIDRFLKQTPVTRYYGSKRKLLAWIYEVTSTLSFDTVLDLFGGTASVSLLFKAMSKKVSYHDGFTFNADVAHTILSDNVALDETWVAGFLERLRPCDGVVAANFDGIYYTVEENRWIDGFMAAQSAQTLGDRERQLLRYLLYQACLKKRPFNLFHRANLSIRTRTDVQRSFGNLTTWNKPFEVHILASLRELQKALVMSPRSHEIIPSTNAQEVAPGYDLVYLDPPYVGHSSAQNRDNYWMKYHFLEGLSRYNEWDGLIDRKANTRHMREPAWMRDWSDKKLFKDLLFSTIVRHRESIVVLSYVADSVPHHQEIESYFRSIFSEVSMFHKSHRYALSGKEKNEILFVGIP